jgi:DNA (cytosine-5)-methyltransferase 1
MPNIDECDAGLWATPNTMDHLPPRSEEGTNKLMEGHRKGRTKPANLREQVDNKTMDMYKQTSSTLWPTPRTAGGSRPNGKGGKVLEEEVKISLGLRQRGKKLTKQMWPTPTTQEIEHPQAELTPNNRRLSKDGNSSHSLNLADSVKMWRTPTAANAKQGPKSKELYEKVKKDGSSAITLVDEVKMFPTPRARDWKDGYTVPPSVKNGTRAHTLGTFIAEKEIMWPTPTTKGYGHASMGQTMIFRKKVEAGEMTEQQAEQMLGCTLRPPRMEKWNYPRKEMFPTPSANEDAAGRPGGKMQKMLGNHPSVRDQSSGTLNPTWVEWLMGYPTGYTDLDV